LRATAPLLFITDVLLVDEESLFAGFFQACADAFFVDRTQSRGRNFQRNPFVLFGNEETLGVKVRVKPALGFSIGMGNGVSYDHLLAC
jgi:hypothetical protein